MKIILGRLYRTQKISDEIFVFCEQLIDGYEWPFPHYSNPFHDDLFDSVEEELLQELGESEGGEPSPVDYEQEVIDAVKEYQESYGEQEPIEAEENQGDLETEIPPTEPEQKQNLGEQDQEMNEEPNAIETEKEAPDAASDSNHIDQ